jgi:serine protease Do
VALTNVTPDLQRSLRLETAYGALVQDVTDGSPGARAGLRPYDLIVAVDGRQVITNDELIQEIAARAPGAVASLDILRDRRPLQLQVRLTERPGRTPPPAAAAAAPDARRLASPNALGLLVREIDRPLPRVTAGVLVTRVEVLGPAADGGVERGQVVMEVNRQKVASVADFERATRDVQSGDVVLLYVYLPDLDQRVLRTIRVEAP